MNSKKFPTLSGMILPSRFEVRYDRAFLIDLKSLHSKTYKRLTHFVFSEFFELTPLQELPEFQAIDNSEILFRFTIEAHLISIEVTGQIIKFLRILPKPNP